jgi:putative transcriptional regulator
MVKKQFSDDEIETLKKEIAGEILISNNLGNTLKKWQNIFEINQKTLAKNIGISNTMLSDYQNGRRLNPNIKFIQKFINSLIENDIKHKEKILKKLIEHKIELSFETKEFKKGIKIKTLENAQKIKHVNIKNNNEIIYGITYLDANDIPSFEIEDIQKIFGKTNKRIFYISNVRDINIIQMFINTLKIITNQNPSVLILETKELDENQINNLDFGNAIYITNSTKQELKELLKEN